MAKNTYSQRVFSSTKTRTLDVRIDFFGFRVDVRYDPLYRILELLSDSLSRVEYEITNIYEITNQTAKKLGGFFDVRFPIAVSSITLSYDVSS